MYDKRNIRIRIAVPDLQSRLLYLWLFELFALTVTRFILSRLGIFESITRTVTLWVVASIPIFVFLFNIRRIEQRKYKAFLGLFLFIIISIVISLLANPELGEYYTRANYGLDRIIRPDCALYAFLFFSMFEEPVKLKKNLTVFAYADFIYLVIVELLPALSRGYWIDIGPRGQELHLRYSLSFGYSIVFPTIVFMYLAIKDKKIHHIGLSLIGLWCVLTQGNRGALLIPIVFAGAMVISGIVGSETTSKKTLKILGVILAIAVVAAFGQSIADAVLQMLGQSGISSRNIDMLLSGKMSNNNGREIIWLTVINAIKNEGIFGYGILGDRPFVSPIHYVGYSHNLFLELIVSFGVIGVLISVYIVVDAIRMIFFCRDNDWRELYIILFSVSFQLMLSMSFWYVWEFWAAAAIAYRYRKLYGRSGYSMNRQIEF